jgi:hypothetical protein
MKTGRKAIKGRAKALKREKKQIGFKKEEEEEKMMMMMMTKKKKNTNKRYVFLVMSINTQFCIGNGDTSIDLKEYYKDSYVLKYAYLIINLILYTVQRTKFISIL